MYQKECKWCNILIIVNKQPNFASHVASCKMNPTNNSLIVSKFKGKLKVERLILSKECLKCGTSFEVKATESEIIKNRVRSYCSRKCANSRVHSKETIEKISNSMKSSEKRYVPNNKGRKYLTRKGKLLDTNKVNEFICLKCNEIGIDERYNKSRKYHLKCWLSISGGIKMGSSRGKCGWYNGFWCDSSYELAYLIYNIEHGIDIKRNKEGFEYFFDGKKNLFYPDFIVENRYVEIKNFRSNLTDSKLYYFPYEIDIYYKDTIKPYIDYVVNKYGKDFINLYE